MGLVPSCEIKQYTECTHLSVILSNPDPNDESITALGLEEFSSRVPPAVGMAVIV